MALALGTPATPAVECDLAFKTVEPRDALNFPGGNAGYGGLSFNKPRSLKQEPRAISNRPLYGDLRSPDEPGACPFRIDESAGNGKGYDRLILDFNHNGDLTDDAAVPRVPGGGAQSSRTEQWLFGPISAPADKGVAGGKPVYYAQVLVSSPQVLSLPARDQPGRTFGVPIGSVRLRLGWYLDGVIDLQGAKHRIGLADANCNLVLGDESPVRVSSGTGEPTWYFRPADLWLVDANGSGKFEADPLQAESAPYSPLFYLGGKPFIASVSADWRKLRLDPWTEPLAEVELQPSGAQVSRLILAREQAGGTWQLIRPQIEAAIIKVPAGHYRLCACTLLGMSAAGEQTMVSGYERVVRNPVRFQANQKNALRVGAPLEIKTTAQKRLPQSYEPVTRSHKDPKLDSDYILSINGRVCGDEGEVYSTFLQGRDLDKEPPKPAFTITDSGGKQIAKGNLEFG